MTKNTICLWYDKDAEAAARFYAETFPDSVVGAVHRGTKPESADVPFCSWDSFAAAYAIAHPC
jgi:predicted 3-demethylubiquinone-9 3-methyltransferase (glyoxalase superfamily)